MGSEVHDIGQNIGDYLGPNISVLLTGGHGLETLTSILGGLGFVRFRARGLWFRVQGSRIMV